MDTRSIKSFQRLVWGFYEKERRELPFRCEKMSRREAGRGRRPRPYEILVSEFMLQQTQVSRVIPKFHAFIQKFPSLESLAAASQRDILEMWSGLGYNRRALTLHRTAQILMQEYNRKIPRDPQVLKSLPGVGDYMSKILPVFVYNDRQVLIETNIRTVFLFHFFKDCATVVHDTEILKLVEETLPAEYVRDWYYALMDYGAHLKTTHKFKNTQSKTYAKQKPFKDSLRYVRGMILKKLLEKSLTEKNVLDLFPQYPPETVLKVCQDLLQEGFISKKGRSFVCI